MAEQQQATSGAEQPNTQQLHELKLLMERFSSPNPAKLLSLVPDHGIRPALGPVSVFCGTPVESTSFDGIEEPVDREACMARDTLPLPALEDREYYHPGRELDYWLSGLRDYYRVRQELDNIGKPLQQDQCLFELGAASGRALRHFACQSDATLRLSCADLNANHVEWVSKYLPPDIAAFQTSALPHLPLEDHSQDVVTAFSVFTHIDEYETAWLMEIKRVLRPGGVAYLTYQSDRTWHSLHEGHFLYQHLKNNQSKLGGGEITPMIFEQPMPQEKVVFRFMDTNVYNTVVFHADSFIRARWGRLFSSIKIVPGAHEFQDVVLCVK